MKAVAPIRREMGIRTIFNTLGPLLNPARVKRQLIGVFDLEVMDLYIEVLQHIGCVHAMVVHGNTDTGAAIDEPSVCGTTYAAELQNGQVIRHTLHPENFGLNRHHIDELRGGDREDNARIIREILDGSASIAKIEAALFASAVTCYISGKAICIDEGMSQSKESLETGKAAAKFDEIVQVSRSVAEKHNVEAN
jgi:anthranilate phosphoribosyltransferase